MPDVNKANEILSKCNPFLSMCCKPKRNQIIQTSKCFAPEWSESRYTNAQVLKLNQSHIIRMNNCKTDVKCRVQHGIFPARATGQHAREKMEPLSSRWKITRNRYLKIQSYSGKCFMQKWVWPAAPFPSKICSVTAENTGVILGGFKLNIRK